MQCRQPFHVDRFVLLSAALCLLSISNVHGALSFNGAESTVVFTHEVTEGGVSRTTTTSGPGIPFGVGSTFGLPDATLSETIGLDTVTSKARAGMGQITSPFTGTGIVKPGTLITQVDLDDASDEFASLSIDFDLKWDVTPPRYGPPIIGAFNIPVLAVVGTGGAAKADIIDMRWQKDTGGVITDVRAPANVSVDFPTGATLTALSVPPAAFVPFLLTPADDFLVNGTVKFSTKNADAPVFFYPELPSLATFVSDSGAVAHLEFNEQMPGVPAAPGNPFDSIAGASNGIYTGNAQYVQGIPHNPGNSAVRLGSTDTVVFGVLSTESFTYEAFIASNAPTFGNGLIAQSGDSGFEIRTVGGTNEFEVFLHDNSGVPTQIIGSDPFRILGNLMDYHHIALTFDGTTNLASVFVDGVLLDSNIFTGTRSAGNPLLITIGNDLNGRVDEVAYYDFARDFAFIEASHLLGQTNPNDFDRLVGSVAGEIPEPTTALLGLLGVVSLAGRRRRNAA